nr:hypothetical protein [Tanacetum cinerariifolium]
LLPPVLVVVSDLVVLPGYCLPGGRDLASLPNSLPRGLDCLRLYQLGFVVDFGGPCLAFVVDIVVVGFVVVEIVKIAEIVEVHWESEGKRIGVGYQMRVSEDLTRKTS